MKALVVTVVLLTCRLAVRIVQQYGQYEQGVLLLLGTAVPQRVAVARGAAVTGTAAGGTGGSA
jgi:hypothetical protein